MLVPLLTIFFKVDIRYAIGASLVSVIATSSGAAAYYVETGVFQHSHRHVFGKSSAPRAPIVVAISKNMPMRMLENPCFYV